MQWKFIIEALGTPTGWDMTGMPVVTDQDIVAIYDSNGDLLASFNPNPGNSFTTIAEIVAAMTGLLGSDVYTADGVYLKVENLLGSLADYGTLQFVHSGDMSVYFTTPFLTDITQTVISEPIGWADATLIFRRDKELHGIFFEYSLPLKFYGDGFSIIKTEYDANGVEGFLRLIIQFKCSDTDAFEDFYLSKLNFTKIKFEESEQCLVELPIEDDTALSLFKNRQDQEVDLGINTSLDGEALVAYDSLRETITLEPKIILKTDRFGYDDADSVEGDSQTGTETETTAGLHTFTSYIWLRPFDVIDELVGYEENYLKGYSNIDTDVLPMWIAPFIGGNDAFTFTLNAEFALQVDAFLNDVTLDGCAPGDRFGDVTVSLIFRRRRAGVYTETTIDTQTFAGCHGAPLVEDLVFTYSGGEPISIIGNDEVSIYYKIEVTGTYTSTGASEQIDVQTGIKEAIESYFMVTIETTYKATTCVVSLINEAFARVVESITNGTMTAYSEYFGRTDSEPYPAYTDGCGALECTATGLQIRRIVGGGKVTSVYHAVSFKQLFDAFNAIHNIGIGLETDPFKGDGSDYVRIEPAAYFYDDTVVLTLDKVPSIIRSVITDEHYSIFEFGYSKWEAEEYNGLDEFNTKRKYRTSLTSVKNTLAKLCGFIASGYAIEITRQQYSQTSKDWRYDNDHFIICLQRDYAGTGFEVEQGNIVSPANIIDPDSVYNFRISPNRNALRWLNKTLASYNEPTVSDGLIFMSGDGNIIAEGQLVDGCFEENAVLSENEEVLSMDLLDTPSEGLPLYELELWEFDYPMSVADYQAVRANPRGLISVRYGQNSDFTDCYIREIEYKPNEGIATFQLLPKIYSVDLDFILQENGDFLLQENGDQLILN